ncbi:MAG: hypothetical protein ACM3H9_00975, partial [Rhodospirillaceae bacterium]
MLQTIRARASVCTAVGCVLLIVAVRPRAQSRTDGASIAAVRQAIFEAEDRRAPAEADLQVLRDGTRHPS